MQTLRPAVATDIIPRLLEDVARRLTARLGALPHGPLGGYHPARVHAPTTRGPPDTRCQRWWRSTQHMLTITSHLGSRGQRSSRACITRHAGHRACAAIKPEVRKRSRRGTAHAAGDPHHGPIAKSPDCIVPHATLRARGAASSSGAKATQVAAWVTNRLRGEPKLTDNAGTCVARRAADRVLAVARRRSRQPQDARTGCRRTAAAM
jgi:hypothetical protein